LDLLKEETSKEGQMGSFNLIDEKWIPCIDDKGRIVELGILDTLISSQKYKDIYDQSPLVVVSIFRLLLAILHRNFGPQNPDEWFALWKKESFNVEILKKYFKECYDMFYLFDEKSPFYQDIKLEVAKKHPIHYLAEEFASGNNSTLFDHSYEASNDLFKPEVAARYLITRQLFSIGFGNSKPFHFKDSPLTRGFTIMIIGNNLFESLMLNLISYSKHRPLQQIGEDLPWWEQENTLDPSKDGSIPRGYLDYLTWQSRKILLFKASDSDMVIGCKIIQNHVIKKNSILDPFKCYKISMKGEISPLNFTEDKSLWRDLHVLFQTKSNYYKRPEIFNWLARLQEYDITLQEIYRLRAIGFTTLKGKAGSILFWRQEFLPIPIEYLINTDLLDSLKECLNLAQEVSDILIERRKIKLKKKKPEQIWILAYLIIVKDGDTKISNIPFNTTIEDEISGQQLDKIKNIESHFSLQRYYWPRLETPFKDLLVKLPKEKEFDENGALIYGKDAQREWAEIVRKTASDAFDKVSSIVGDSARVLKAWSKAKDLFDMRLNTTIKQFLNRKEGEHETENAGLER